MAQAKCIEAVRLDEHDGADSLAYSRNTEVTTVSCRGTRSASGQPKVTHMS